MTALIGRNVEANYASQADEKVTEDIHTGLLSRVNAAKMPLCF